MIARTRVNYSAGDLLRALFVSEGGCEWRDALRAELQRMFETTHVQLTASGRGALHQLLLALPQERIVVPAYTCKAVVETALLAGKKVSHVEVEPDGFNMEVSQLDAILDSNCIVIATHQFGIPCAIERICAACREKGALVIEDAAAAFGSRVDGRLVGTFGDAAFFSFDSTKLINVPLKAGCLVVHDEALFQKVKQHCEKTLCPMGSLHKLTLLMQAAVMLLIETPMAYRLFHKLHFEWRGRFTADGPELNSKAGAFTSLMMAEWQAMIALRQLKNIEPTVRRRRQMYALYLEKLDGCKSFKLPPADKKNEWACVRFPICVRGDKFAFYRESCRRGVDMAFSFTFINCPHEMKRARELAGSVLDLPFYSKLTNAEIDKTVRVLKEIDS